MYIPLRYDWATANLMTRPVETTGNDYYDDQVSLEVTIHIRISKYGHVIRKPIFLLFSSHRFVGVRGS